MNKMGEENGNERYLVNVSKLEKLMEEKRNEKLKKRKKPRALIRGSRLFCYRQYRLFYNYGLTKQILKIISKILKSFFAVLVFDI